MSIRKGVAQVFEACSCLFVIVCHYKSFGEKVSHLVVLNGSVRPTVLTLSCKQDDMQGTKPNAQQDSRQGDKTLITKQLMP